jgi:hypothetical protein
MARKIRKRGDKSSGSKQIKIKTQNFIDLLNHVNLSGVISECVVLVNKGKAKVHAVDATQSLVVITQANIMSKNMNLELGLGNVELLSKFLATIEDNDVAVKHSNSIFTLMRKDGRRKLEYLLTQPEFISTKLIEEDSKKDPYKTMVGLTTVNAELTSTFIKDYLNYIGMLKTKDTTIILDRGGLKFVCGGTDDHQFELTLSSDVEGEDDGEWFESKANGEHLAKVLATVNNEYDQDEPPVIMLGERVPTVIENGMSLWALMPLYDTEQDEDEEE